MVLAPVQLYQFLLAGARDSYLAWVEQCRQFTMRPLLTEAQFQYLHEYSGRLKPMHCARLDKPPIARCRWEEGPTGLRQFLDCVRWALECTQRGWDLLLWWRESDESEQVLILGYDPAMIQVAETEWMVDDSDPLDDFEDTSGQIVFMIVEGCVGPSRRKPQAAGGLDSSAAAPADSSRERSTMGFTPMQLLQFFDYHPVEDYAEWAKACQNQWGTVGLTVERFAHLRQREGDLYLLFDEVPTVRSGFRAELEACMACIRLAAESVKLGRNVLVWQGETAKANDAALILAYEPGTITVAQDDDTKQMMVVERARERHAEEAAMLVYSFDWSGGGRHCDPTRTIAVFGGHAGDVPELPRGRDGRWSRVHAFEYLCDRAEHAAKQGPILVGMDFAFSFPFAEKNHAFPDGSAARAAFWQAVRAAAWPDDRGTADGYVLDNPNEGHFRRQIGGNHNRQIVTGAQYNANAFRLTERAAMQGDARPCCVFNLIGANQVGKGSICGIAVLKKLAGYCLQHHLPLVIWPFLGIAPDGQVQEANCDLPEIPDRTLVIVETWPGLHWRQARQQRVNWNDNGTWGAIRAHFGANQVPVQLDSPDEADALIAWYALAGVADVDGNPLGLNRVQQPSPALTARVATDPGAVFQEGWIFGV